MLDTDVDVEEISNLRYGVDNLLAQVPGVQWHISAISGVYDKRKKKTKYHIDVLVGYTKSEANKTDFLFRVMHDCGLLVDKPSHTSDDHVLEERIHLLFKDHSTPAIRNVITTSNDKLVRLANDGESSSVKAGLAKTSLR